MSFAKLQWIFPVAVTLHNGEEGLFMPAWVSTHRSALPLHPGAMKIRLCLFLLTVAAWVVTWMSRRTGRRSVWTYLLFGGAATMLANVLVPHVPATVHFRGYTPGVVTAVLINLPVMSTLLRQALRERWVLMPRAAGYALLVPLTLAAGVAALFSLSR